MRRLALLTWLSLRELWMTFRLLAGLALLLAAALPLALLPPEVVPDLAGAPPDRLGWFAMALAGAVAAIAALAAQTLAIERRRGSVGWLALRAVPRSSILLGWFVAFAVLLVLGLAPAAVLAWLALGFDPALVARPGAFAAAQAGVFVSGLASVAFGLLAGALLPRLAAVLLTALAAGTILLATVLVPLDASGWPFASLAALAHLDDAITPIADSLRATGLALALTAGLLLLAGAALDRADL
ncbi:MAG TPA: hypothetical protein VFH63_08260 [candidate division Zixibacteria bacterium]|nr:hypothetical protein [candidate division Zixibacteria bacterium]